MHGSDSRGYGLIGPSDRDSTVLLIKSFLFFILKMEKEKRFIFFSEKKKTFCHFRTTKYSISQQTSGRVWRKKTKHVELLCYPVMLSHFSPAPVKIDQAERIQ